MDLALLKPVLQLVLQYTSRNNKASSLAQLSQLSPGSGLEGPPQPPTCRGARYMKINQLFNKAVPEELAEQVIQCFNLSGSQDRRTFSKYDMETHGTVQCVTQLVPQLEGFYMPCKARTYLHDLTPKKCVTILKQIIRLHGMTLMSRERNLQGRKVIFYQIMGSGDYERLRRMTSRSGGSFTVEFRG